MRTRRLMTTVSAVLAMLAVIGSGFSYWFFTTGQTTSANQGTIGKNVTQLVTAGTITPAADFTVSFDQTAAGRSANGGSVNLGTGDTTEGIQIVFSQGATTTATYSGPTLDPTTSGDPGFSYTFTVTVTVSKDLAAYFDIDSANSAWIITTATDASDNAVITFTSTTSKTFNWTTDVTLTYKSGKEPTDKDTLTTFRNVVNNTANTITVTYTATVGTDGN